MSENQAMKNKLLNDLSNVRRGIDTEPVKVSIYNWRAFMEYLRNKCDVPSLEDEVLFWIWQYVIEESIL